MINKKDIIKNYCSNCQNETNHLELFNKKINSFSEDDYHDETNYFRIIESWGVKI